jgi:hypothetical protein
LKKSAVFALLLLILAVAGTWAAGVTIHAAADQVALTRRDIYGEVDAARGLTVTLNSVYRNRLLWTTTASALEAEGTKFTYSPTRITQTDTPSYSGLEMYTQVDLGADPSDGVTLPGLDAAYEELSAATPAGQEAEKTIYLRDYLDYYPLSLQLELPNYWGILDSQSSPAMQQAQQPLQTIQEYFKIPVLEEEQCQITLGKSEEGHAWHWGFSSAEGDSYNMWTLSAVTSDACYFTFNTLTQEGKVVDTSALPDGYGIYRLPYETDRDGNTCPLAEELEMVYPLEPGTDLLDLHVSPEEDCLLLHTAQNGRYLLTVIDLADLSTRQILDVAPFDREESSWRLYKEGDFLVAAIGGNTLAVLPRQADGSYTLAHLWDAWPPEQGDLAFSTWNVALDYDGERLALAGILDDEEGYQWDTCNYYLAVYQGEGLVYYGEYLNSLYTSGQDLEDYEYACRSRYTTPLELAWTPYT